MKTNINAAVLSIISNSILITIKIIASLVTGSISILSEALHSLSDLAASIITFYSVRSSYAPPDKKHPYGHGRYENVSASIEALLVILAAIYIMYEAILRINNPTTIDYPSIAIFILILSIIINFFMSKYLYNVSKKTLSLAIEGDALHLKADMITSFGLVVGFIAISIFKIAIIDTIMALLVALYMLIEGFLLFNKAFMPLMDVAISPRELEQINNYFISNNLKIHDLKTRRSGTVIYADVHLELPPDITLKEAHDICDNIEKDIKNLFTSIEINIHVEPK